MLLFVVCFLFFFLSREMGLDLVRCLGVSFSGWEMRNGDGGL